MVEHISLLDLQLERVFAPFIFVLGESAVAIAHLTVSISFQNCNFVFVSFTVLRKN